MKIGKPGNHVARHVPDDHRNAVAPLIVFPEKLLII